MARWGRTPIDTMADHAANVSYKSPCAHISPVTICSLMIPTFYVALFYHIYNKRGNIDANIASNIPWHIRTTADTSFAHARNFDVLRRTIAGTLSKREYPTRCDGFAHCTAGHLYLPQRGSRSGYLWRFLSSSCDTMIEQSVWVVYLSFLSIDGWIDVCCCCCSIKQHVVVWRADVSMQAQQFR